MCQLNLDAYQARVNSFFAPFQDSIVFFTQMVGSPGIDRKAGFGKEIVSAAAVVVASGKKVAGVRTQKQKTEV